MRRLPMSRTKRLLCTIFMQAWTLFVLHADIYKPHNQRAYTKIIIFFDLDKVVLNESGGLGKLLAALTAVPLKKSVPILLRQRNRLAKLVKAARYDGQKLKGLKANL